MIRSTQKIIRVGTSAAITLPAKELIRQNLKVGDEVKVTVEATEPRSEVLEEYDRFVSLYGDTLKNLADK